MHGVELAAELGVPRVLIPHVPGITCALGCIVADVRHDFVQTVSRAVDKITEGEIAAVLQAQRAAGEARLRADDVPVERIEVGHEADMQYEGQTYSLRVGLDPDQLDVASLRDQLRNAYLTRFGIDLVRFRAKIINIRTRVVGIRPRLDLRRIVATGERRRSVAEAVTGERSVWFPGGRVTAPIYARERLPEAAVFEGPAIVDQLDTTSVITPGTTVTLDDCGNLLVGVVA